MTTPEQCPACCYKGDTKIADCWQHMSGAKEKADAGIVADESARLARLQMIADYDRLVAEGKAVRLIESRPAADLPEVPHGYYNIPSGYDGQVYLHAQLRSYARAAIAADRSRAALASPAPDAAALVEALTSAASLLWRVQNAVPIDVDRRLNIEFYRRSYIKALRAYDQQTGGV